MTMCVVADVKQKRSAAVKKPVYVSIKESIFKIDNPMAMLPNANFNIKSYQMMCIKKRSQSEHL